MGRVFPHAGQRHLVRPPKAFHLMAVHFFGARPALGAAQNDHGPPGAGRLAARAGFLLNAPDFEHTVLERRGHLLVHLLGIAAFHEVRRPAVAHKQGFQFVVGDAGKHGGIVDLIAVELQDRQHRAVPDRVQELVRMPGGGQGAGFGFSIANHHGHQQVGIVVRGAEGMRDAVAQLAALVNRTGCFRCAVTADAAGKGKLLEELAHSYLILALIGVNLRIGALEVGRGQHAGRAVPRSGHEDRVQIVLFDQPVEMDVNEA